MKKRFMAVTAVVAGGVLGLAGCGSAEGGGDDGDPYRVLVLGGISAEGPLGDNASTSVLAAKAAVEDINKKGGIDGREVVITVADDKADPTTAVTRLREALNSDDRPDVVLNSGPSTVADATLPILNQNKVLSFNIGPTEDSADPSKFPLNFDLSPTVPDYAKGFVAHVKDKGYQTVGILHGSSSYGETFGKSMVEVLEEEGIEVSEVEEYDIAALDMTPQLQKIRSTQPDALILDAYGAPLGYVLKGIEKLAMDVPLLGNTSVAATGLIATESPSGVLGTPQVENLVMEVFQSTKHSPDATAVNEAVAHMKKLGDIKASLIVAYNYDTMGLIAAAAESVGSADDPEKVADALEKPDVLAKAETAILGDYGFSPESHSPNVGADAFAFISPSPLEDGQFH